MFWGEGMVISSREKQAAYSTDIYFREGERDFGALQGAEFVLDRCAILVLTPDAICARRAATALDALEDYSFTVVAEAAFRYNRHMLREVWRHQSTPEDIDRIQVVDLALTRAPSLLLCLRDDDATTKLPGSVRLASLKGSARLVGSDSARDSLRGRLGARCPLLNFVHTCDEPADIVREVPIYLGRRGRARFLAQASQAKDRRAAAYRTLSELERQTPVHDLDFESSVARLRAVVDGCDRVSVRQEAGAVLDRLSSFQGFDWTRLSDLLSAAGVEYDAWDLVTVATEVVSRCTAAESRVLPEPSPSDWLSLVSGQDAGSTASSTPAATSTSDSASRKSARSIATPH